MKPTMGRIVWYRGRYGLCAMRPAWVVCTTEELMPEGVETGEAAPLDSDMHVHLVVGTIGSQMMFPESNVPHGVPGEDGKIPPGTWCWPEIKH